jgi:lipopolysaccharide export system permease protein
LRILFITANRLGDAVLSTGVLNVLIERYPAARITVACGALPSSLFAGIPQVDRVIVLVKQALHGHWRKLWQQVIATRWDLVVDLRNTLVSRLVLSNSLRVFAGPKPRQHMVEALAALVVADPRDAAPRLWLDGAAEDPLLATLPAGTPLLALAPGAHGVGKRWPSERYAELAVRLTAPGGALADGTVVILGSGDERQEAAAVLAALPPERVIDRVGHTDPRGAGAWLARADLYVGNDSGLTHLAAAAGAPTLALFGPGIPSRYRPWGRNTRYLVAEEDPARSLDLCKIDDMLALSEMKKLSVEHVLAAAEALCRPVADIP